MDVLYSPVSLRTIHDTEMVRFLIIGKVREISSQETPHQRNTACSARIR
jgi:hypothetical protein